MSVEAFFQREGERFLPTDRSRGPWDRESLHGRVISGLLAYAIEQRHGDEGFHPARLTTDMFRLAPHAPVEVATRVAREGNRIRVVDATMIAGGVEVARASVVLLRKAEQPPGQVWTPPSWDAPPPEQLPEPRYEGRPERALTWEPAWETRTVGEGGFGSLMQKRAWLRETVDFIEGEATSPFMRVAAAADFANPLANSGDAGLNFINSDVTLYLHRLPVDEWVGFEVMSHQSHEGVAVGECALYDREGPIGRSLVCAVAQVQRRR
jgi:acyl-CoA thioesterase